MVTSSAEMQQPKQLQKNLFYKVQDNHNNSSLMHENQSDQDNIEYIEGDKMVLPPSSRLSEAN